MNARNPEAAAISGEELNHPTSVSAFRTVRLLVGAYLVISVLTLLAIVLLRNEASVVNSAVRVRGGIVVASASVMSVCVARAARGSRPAFRRLRILSGVMVAAIAVIIALPGTFPLWMKLEQGLCGIVLVGVVCVVNGAHLRRVFAAR